MGTIMSIRESFFLNIRGWTRASHSMCMRYYAPLSQYHCTKDSNKDNNSNKLHRDIFLLLLFPSLSAQVECSFHLSLAFFLSTLHAFIDGEYPIFGWSHWLLSSSCVAAESIGSSSFPFVPFHLCFCHWYVNYHYYERRLLSFFINGTQIKMHTRILQAKERNLTLIYWGGKYLLVCVTMRLCTRNPFG